jgi:penicillin amidase
MALRWVPNDTSAFQFPVLELNRARNWQEFRAALARWPGPGQNFVYADVDGNIGYQAAGRLPVRRGYNGDLPVDGSSGEFDWDGYIPFDKLPSAFNPPDGMIATANQNPFPPGSPWPVNGNFAPPYRVRQIRDLLAAGSRWTPERLLRVQTDVYSGFDRFIAAQAVGAYDRRRELKPALDPAVALLRHWNGQMDQDQGAPFLAELLYQHIRSAMAESAAPGKAGTYDFQGAPAAVEKLLRERPPGWFRDYDEMLLRALADAVEEGGRIQGRDPGRWRYGNYLRITIAHPVVHQVPLAGKYFDIGPVAMSGSRTTVKQTTRSVAPSMRMNADLGDWERSLQNLPIGQSGQIFSRHYRDQWPDYYYGRGEPMRFGNVEAKSTLVFGTSQ